MSIESIVSRLRESRTHDTTENLENEIVKRYLDGDNPSKIASDLDITRADVKVVVDDYLESRKRRDESEDTNEGISLKDIYNILISHNIDKYSEDFSLNSDLETITFKITTGKYRIEGYPVGEYTVYEDEGKVGMNFMPLDSNDREEYKDFDLTLEEFDANMIDLYRYCSRFYESADKLSTADKEWSYWEMPDNHRGPFEYPHYYKEYTEDVTGYIYPPYESPYESIKSLSKYYAELYSVQHDSIAPEKGFDTIEDAKKYLDDKASEYLSKESTNESLLKTSQLAPGYNIKDEENYISVEYTYNGDDTSDYLGHVKVRTDFKVTALQAAEKYAMNKHPEDDPRHFIISDTDYTNVDIIDKNGNIIEGLKEMETLKDIEDAPYSSSSMKDESGNFNVSESSNFDPITKRSYYSNPKDWREKHAYVKSKMEDAGYRCKGRSPWNSTWTNGNPKEDIKVDYWEDFDVIKEYIAKSMNESEDMMSDKDYDSIERSGTDEEYTLAALSYNFGMPLSTVKKMLANDEFTEDEIARSKKLFGIRDLPLATRVAMMKESDSEEDYRELDKERERRRENQCEQCGSQLTDSGECPKCDLGEEDIDESPEYLSSFEKETMRKVNADAPSALHWRDGDIIYNTKTEESAVFLGYKKNAIGILQAIFDDGVSRFPYSLSDMQEDIEAGILVNKSRE